MKTLAALIAVAALAAATPAAAKGCLKGAVVGGVAGHYAGHHGVLGAIAGCAYGRHRANEQQRERQGQRQAPRGGEAVASRRPANLDCHPRERGEPVITAVGGTFRQPGVLGRPVKPGDDSCECCALVRFTTSDSNFKQPSASVLAPPRELGF